MRSFGYSLLGIGVVLLAVALGCDSTDPPGSDGADAAGSDGSASDGSASDGSASDGSGSDGAGRSASDGEGTGGAPLARSDCGLPLFGAPGQAAPNGTVGGLEVIDWAGATFAVSYTFDDSNSSQVSAYADLQALGVPMTFYLQTGKSESEDPVWQQALDDGHELGNHTESHLQEADGTDIDAATMFIEETFGVPPLTMAAPYGDDSYIPLAQERFFINRGVPGGSMAPLASTNVFNLPCYVPPTGATAAAMNTPIDTARSQGRWQIVLVHGFTGGSDAAYQPVGLADFLATVEHAKSLGDGWIDTVALIGSYFIGQKLVAEATPEVEGESTTWSWALPPHFPADRCVRVRVDGGTLRQGDEELTWSEHGYYEVDLDAGSLTLSP